MQVESTSKPMLTVDEVEQIQRKKVATIIGHVFQLTYASLIMNFDWLMRNLLTVRNKSGQISKALSFLQSLC